MGEDLQLKVSGENIIFENINKVALPLSREDNSTAFIDVSESEATPEDVALGVIFFNSNGELLTGTSEAQGTGGGYGGNGTIRYDGNGIPIIIDNDRDMNLAMRGDNIGRVFRFIGENSLSYEQGQLYLCVGGYQWAHSD